ncbi:MAG TPA: hypothetical protein VF715_02155 [Thermoleophilaceae bacterium]
MEAEHPLLALGAAVALALTHLLAGRLGSLSAVPRSRWLSAAGGVSVAYVFVHLLPELSEAQDAVAEEAEGVLPFLESHVYLLALAGLSLFYGVEIASRRSRAASRGGDDATGPAAFWLSIGSFATYNALIGYLLLHREDPGSTSLILFAVAIAVHFVVNDHGLRAHHKAAYDRIGRWLLAASVLGGWVAGRLTEVSDAAVGLLIAFLAGGVVLNVLKEELPEERQSRFGAFVLGVLVYAALLEAI